MLNYHDKTLIQLSTNYISNQRKQNLPETDLCQNHKGSAQIIISSVGNSHVLHLNITEHKVQWMHG